METQAFYDSLQKKILGIYPSAATALTRSDWQKAFSPFAVPVPQSCFDQARAAVKAFYRLRSDRRYIDAVAAEEGVWIKTPNRQASVLMAYGL